jgi:hypothetical protein
MTDHNDTAPEEHGFVFRSPSSFGKLFADVMHNTSLSFGARVLYGHMHWRFGRNKKNYEGQESMADMLGTSTRSIQRWSKELAEHDWIIIRHRKRRGQYTSNIYLVFESQDLCRQAQARLARTPQVADGHATPVADGHATPVADNPDSEETETDHPLGEAEDAMPQDGTLPQFIEGKRGKRVPIYSRPDVNQRTTVSWWMPDDPPLEVIGYQAGCYETSEGWIERLLVKEVAGATPTGKRRKPRQHTTQYEPRRPLYHQNLSPVARAVLNHLGQKWEGLNNERQERFLANMAIVAANDIGENEIADFLAYMDQKAFEGAWEKGYGDQALARHAPTYRQEKATGSRGSDPWIEHNGQLVRLSTIMTLGEDHDE